MSDLEQYFGFVALPPPDTREARELLQRIRASMQGTVVDEANNRIYLPQKPSNNLGKLFNRLGVELETQERPEETMDADADQRLSTFVTTVPDEDNNPDPGMESRRLPPAEPNDPRASMMAAATNLAMQATEAMFLEERMPDEEFAGTASMLELARFTEIMSVFFRTSKDPERGQLGGLDDCSPKEQFLWFVSGRMSASNKELAELTILNNTLEFVLRVENRQNPLLDVERSMLLYHGFDRVLSKWETDDRGLGGPDEGAIKFMAWLRQEIANRFDRISEAVYQAHANRYDFTPKESELTL